MTTVRRPVSLLLLPVVVAVTGAHALAGSMEDAPTGSQGDNPASGAAAPHVAAVALTVTGFTSENAAVIRAQKPSLDERLAFLTDSSGVSVNVGLAKGSQGTDGSVVTVDERVSATLDGLGLVQGPMGHRALNLRRATLTATYVNLWLGLGPIRAAVEAGNMPLAEALGDRGLLVRYTNTSGAVLSMVFTPSYGRCRC